MDYSLLPEAAKCFENGYATAHSGHNPLLVVLDGAGTEKASERWKRRRVAV